MTDIIDGTCCLKNLNLDNSEKYTCNICVDDIDSNSELVQLKCNPNHYFCYQCIYDWYLKCDKYTGYGNQYPERTCPICKKNGGYLPLNSNYKTIDTIHSVPKCSFYSYAKCQNSVKENNMCELHFKYTNNKCCVNECNKPLYNIYEAYSSSFSKSFYCNDHYLSTTNKCNEPIEFDLGSNKKTINYCTGRKFKKFGNKCSLHSTVPNTTKLKEKKLPAAPCGAPLKSKKGNCSKLGNEKYGGKCYLHKIII